MSRIERWPVSSSSSQTVSRILTCSGTANVMPRSWHSSTSYLCLSVTGSPQTSHRLMTFLFRVPHEGQSTSSPDSGSTRMTAPHERQLDRRWCNPSRLPHLHCQE